MNRLAAVTEGTRTPGVYRWLSRAHPESVRRELTGAGWSVHLLDGRTVTGSRPLFDACAATLSFPAWFGHNWDAFADCVGDLGWLTGRGHVLIWDQYGVLARHDPKAWAMAHRVFGTAIADRVRAGAVPLYVLLRGTGPVDAPDGPELIPPL
jgi:hypothetical protein